MLFSTFKFFFFEKCPFTYWLNGRWFLQIVDRDSNCWNLYPLNGRWFLQIVDRDSWNLYPLYPLFPCSDFVSQMWGWFGGGGCNVFLTFYAIYNISRRKIFFGNTKCFFFEKNNYFSFNVFFVFFLCWKYWKVPLHILVKWEVVSPNSRYREF